MTMQTVHNIYAFSFRLALFWIYAFSQCISLATSSSNGDSRVPMETTETFDWDVFEHFELYNIDEFRAMNETILSKENIFTLLFPFPWQQTSYDNYMPSSMVTAIDTYGRSNPWVKDYMFQ